jgi:hypothetical protein
MSHKSLMKFIKWKEKNLSGSRGEIPKVLKRNTVPHPEGEAWQRNQKAIKIILLHLRGIITSLSPHLLYSCVQSLLKQSKMKSCWYCLCNILFPHKQQTTLLPLRNMAWWCCIQKQLFLNSPHDYKINLIYLRASTSSCLREISKTEIILGLLQSYRSPLYLHFLFSFFR